MLTLANETKIIKVINDYKDALLASESQGFRAITPDGVGLLFTEIRKLGENNIG